MVRSPQRTLLPGLGVASAVLAGVLVAVTLAAGMLGVEFPDGDPPRGPATALQIEARSEAAARAREIGRVPARAASSGRTAAPAPAPSTGFDDATGRGDLSPALVVEPAPGPSQVALAPPLPPPAPDAQTARPPAAPPAGAAAATAPARPANPLEPLGTGVNDTTDDVAATLRTLTQDLGDDVTPLSPQLGGVLTQTGDALGDVVEGTGNVLGLLLGRPAGRR